MIQKAAGLPARLEVVPPAEDLQAEGRPGKGLRAENRLGKGRRGKGRRAEDRLGKGRRGKGLRAEDRRAGNRLALPPECGYKNRCRCGYSGYTLPQPSHPERNFFPRWNSRASWRARSTFSWRSLRR